MSSLKQRLLAVIMTAAIIITGLNISPQEAKAANPDMTFGTIELNEKVTLEYTKSTIEALKTASKTSGYCLKLEVPRSCIARLSLTKNYELDPSGYSDDGRIGICTRADIIDSNKTAIQETPSTFFTEVNKNGLYNESLSTLADQTKAVEDEDDKYWEGCTSKMQNYFCLLKGTYYLGIEIPGSTSILEALNEAGQSSLTVGLSIATVNYDGLYQTFEEPLPMPDTPDDSNNNTSGNATLIKTGDTVHGILGNPNNGTDWYKVNVDTYGSNTLSLSLDTDKFTTTDEKRKTEKVSTLNDSLEVQCRVYKNIPLTSSTPILDKTFGKDNLGYDGTISCTLETGEDYYVCISSDNHPGHAYSNFNTYAGAYIFTITDETIHPSGLTLNKTDLTLKTGESYSLTATVQPDNALNKNVTWKSENTAIATVSTDGTVTGVAEGTTSITATTEDRSKTDTCQVTVSNSVIIEPGDNTIVIGKQISGTGEASYSLTIDKSSVYRFTTTYSDTASDLHISFYDKYNSKTHEWYGDKGSKDISLLKGQYVIKFSGRYTSTQVKDYTLNVSPVNLSENFQSFEEEYGASGGRNDVRMDAFDVSANNTYHGLICTGNVDDWYKLVLNSGDTVNIKYKGANFERNSVDIRIQIYKTTMSSSIWDRGMDLTFNDYTVTEPGVYYIDVSAYYSNYTPEGTYEMTLTGSSSDNSKRLVIDPASTSIESGKTVKLTAYITPVKSSPTSSPSPLELKWTSSNESIATITGYGAGNNPGGIGAFSEVSVIGRETGTATITAATTDQNYSAIALITVTDTGSAQEYTVTYMPNNGQPDTTYKFSYTENLDKVRVRSSLYKREGYIFTGWNTQADGKGTAYAAGSTMELTGNLTLYAQWKESVTPTIRATEINFPQNVYTMKAGEKRSLEVAYTPSNADPIDLIYSSADKTVATVDSSTGMVTAVKPGYGYIYVRSMDGKLKANCVVKVTDTTVRVYAIETHDILVAEEGSKGILEYAVYPSDAADKTVTATSSNPSVITIDNEGNYNAISEGEAVITFTTNDGGYTASCYVTVTDKSAETIPVTGVELSESIITLKPEETIQLKSTVYPENATNKNVTYRCTDNDVAVVTMDGACTGKAPGNALITVETADGGFWDTCIVTVTDKDTPEPKPEPGPEPEIPVTSIALSRTSTTLKPGGSIQLSARITPSNATDKTVTWESQAPEVATVTADGTVLGITDGDTVITATSADGKHKASCKVYVNDPMLTHYRITYNLGIADPSSNLDNPEYYTEGETFALSPAIQEGLIFKGWYKDAKFTYAVSKINSTDKGDKTFYAKWTTKTYRITYDSNGGTTVNNKTSYNVTTPTFKLKSPSRKYYKFLGWYTEDMVEIEEIEKGTTGDLALTAVWAPQEYKLTYKTNGGELYNPPETYYTDEVLELPIPVKNGCDFLGWKLDGKIVTAIPAKSTGNKTLTAVWDALTYTITYDSNGGSEVKNPTSYTPDTKTFKLKNPTKKGYKFDGWYDETGEKVTSIKKGSYGDYMLVAIWTPKEYKIKYKLNGGHVDDAPTSYTIEDEIIFPEPYKDTCIFSGWKQGKEYVDMIVPGTMGDITLQATWTVYQYPIKYELKGGELEDAPSVYSTYESLELPIPTRNGYDFTGWKMGNRIVTAIPARSTGKKVVTATWKPLTYTILYDPNGGSDVKNPSSYTPDTKTFKLVSPTRKGYKFDGWYDEAGEKTISIKKGSYGDMALTAIWSPISYKLAYKTSGGVIINAPESYTVEDIIELPEAYRNGYVFAGWKLGGQYATAIGPGMTGNKTLTAVWERE